MLIDFDFKLAYLTFRMAAEETIELPAFQGPILRGSFGKVFREAVCLQRQKECDQCSLLRICAYVYLFESRRLPGNEQNWKTSHDPHPFVLEPPPNHQSFYHPGETFTISLSLIGEGISYLPYFIFVFEAMGRRGISSNFGRFRVAGVTASDGTNKMEIYDSDTKTLQDKFPLVTPAVLNEVSGNAFEVAVDFLTPARLQQMGKVITHIDFPQLVRALMRRYSWLSSLYCGSLPDLPYQDLLERAECDVRLIHSELVWQNLERYSYRQEQKVKLSGVVGKAIYCGKLSQFLPLLRLGEYLHIGKGTAFGLGKYRLTAKE